jgi:hypothetical protein
VKRITVTLPEELVAEIDIEASYREMTRSEVIEERLEAAASSPRRLAALKFLANAMRSVEGLAGRFSERQKRQLRTFHKRKLESIAENFSRFDVLRERLQSAVNTAGRKPRQPIEIADLIGSVGDLPTDLSARKKNYLKATGYGPKRRK